MSSVDIFDITKNIVVAAPAGSGKTEKLSRRYIALLSAGVSPERILAVTFTEKAAAEMKERILKILKSEKEEIYSELKEKIFLMRISTIHSFCLSLLKRFAFELKIDPNFEITDPEDSGLIDTSIGTALTTIIEGKDKGTEELRKYVVDLSTKHSWRKLKDFLYRFFMLRPASLAGKPSYLDISNFKTAKSDASRVINSDVYFQKDFKEIVDENDPSKLLYILNGLYDMFISTSGTPRKRKPKEAQIDQDTYEDFNIKMLRLYVETEKYDFNMDLDKLFKLFLFCHNVYDLKKKEMNVLDFNDLEYLTYKLLNDNPEVDNILFAFDEQTDHILIDEFQDTNFLQWGIIKKLTEEWRAGLGSKREAGINPTLFIVGDDKQSIYGFRNANVEVFDTAVKEMEKWYGKLFLYENVKENFRCGTEIVGFVNETFSRIMLRGRLDPFWKTRYERFNPIRNISGRVEILEVLEGKGQDMAEANLVAEKIKKIVSKDTKFYKNDAGVEIESKISYKDIAVLLRKRTHLADFENSFINNNIDFVVVNGLGFYQQPETVALRSLLFTLIEPSDDYSLYLLLKSPVFLASEDEIFEFNRSAGLTLFEKIKSADKYKVITEHVNLINELPLNHILEAFLEKVNGWKIFWEPQRVANIKKFIQIVQDFESKGKSLQDIREYFEKRIDADEEPKANLNTEDTNAVRIMTVHTAKGLEFPVVFFVRMGEESRKDRDAIRIKSTNDGTLIIYCPEKKIREEEKEFIELKEKEEEEEKRIFYVAVTRARDYLILSGVKSEKKKGFWKYL